jgi:hypothetical protein
MMGRAPSPFGFGSCPLVGTPKPGRGVVRPSPLGEWAPSKEGRLLQGSGGGLHAYRLGASNRLHRGNLAEATSSSRRGTSKHNQYVTSDVPPVTDVIIREIGKRAQ